ncbi:hypothetical protein MLD38_008298 [Melastoma candidum]|uniref:Uncharacterized protein n=1 Tax=Melastoma candidum TaxID=119954 RepID=A0ACB9RTC5_9MYRT|nr:hypothetical protein MLD38_008298 [Melastoma candidum]
MKEQERSLDPQLWHACAGGMVQMPPLNSKVFYFPQGHAEHASSPVDFPNSSRIPPLVLCRMAAVKFLADPETDEVYAKIGLIPLRSNELDHEDDGAAGRLGSDHNPEKPASFAKTLTQSDANNGGGFSVPRYCAETIFPKLDYSVDPPVQTVIAKDVHGELWKFRHIYRGTPRRHLLTTGWSTFVNQKKLVAGDSIVFLRAENGDLCVGIRRAKRGIGGVPESHGTGWNSGNPNCISPFGGGFSVLLREEESKFMRGKRRVRPESVVEAVNLAGNGHPFEVVYYPRASTPEFCVRAGSVKAGMRIQWCSGMRFKMPFETEDSSRISWFMGTISSVQVADPIRWPNSPWRLLQVTWDEPDLLQNVKRVSPWLVELVSNIPAIHISPFSPPRKKLRLPSYPDFLLDANFLSPSFRGNPHGPSSPLCCLSNNAPAGIQGARQAQLGIMAPSDHLNHKFSRLGWLSSPNLQHFEPRYFPRIPGSITTKDNTPRGDSLSCVLSMGISNQKPLDRKACKEKKPHFLLFGKPILTEQQIASGHSGDSGPEVIDGNCLSDGVSPKAKFPFGGLGYPSKGSELCQDTGHCKVFLESEDVGRTLDMTVIGSYDELYKKLASMFGIERSEMLSHVLYQDAVGETRRAGKEPFSEFVKTVKRLTIFVHSGSGGVGVGGIGRPLVTGMRAGSNGFEPATTKAGPLSTYA